MLAVLACPYHFAWRMFHYHSILRFLVIATQKSVVKGHFINNPSLPHHPSQEKSPIPYAVVSDAANWFVSAEGQTSVVDDGLGYV